MQEIDELNSSVKCKVAPSKVHGVGVFAIRDIASGEKLYCKPHFLRRWYSLKYEYFNELRPEVRDLIVGQWPCVVNRGLFLSPNDVWLLCFMNHSSTPNYDPNSDTALRKINAGEEILEDYRRMPNSTIAFPFLKNLHE